jgi:hypothetical protein
MLSPFSLEKSKPEVERSNYDTRNVELAWGLSGPISDGAQKWLLNWGQGGRKMWERMWEMVTVNRNKKGKTETIN